MGLVWSARFHSFFRDADILFVGGRGGLVCAFVYCHIVFWFEWLLSL